MAKKTEIIFNGKLFKLMQSYSDFSGELVLHFELTREQCEEMKIGIRKSNKTLLIEVTETDDE